MRTSNNKNTKVTKAVIPAAGMGTRFLPQTKAMPKEMLPVVDKPVIQMVVEELVDVGVTDIIIVTGTQKRSIEDHFDRSVEMEESLMNKGKEDSAKQIREIAEMANFVYVRQKGYPLGNARPVLNASHLLGDEPFFVLFPDDFFQTERKTRARQLLEVYEETGGSVVSCMQVDKSDADKYGMVDPGEAVDGGVRIKQLMEKPGPDKTPSTLAAVGGYLLTPDIMPYIEQEKVGAGGELVLADSINELAQSKPVYGREVDGIYHDAGNKQRYLQAVVDMTLAHPELGPEFKEFLRRKQL